MKTLDLELSDNAYQRFLKTGRLPQKILNHARRMQIDSQGKLVIDEQPADNGKYHTQKDWIGISNKQEGEFKGKRLICSYDVINASRNQPDVVPSLIQDAKSYWLATGTHNSLKPQTLAGDVIHNYQSTVVKPTVISLDEIPVLERVPILKVVEMPSGLLYVRALANNMKADKKDLLKDFESLAKEAKRGIEDVVFWTPSQGGRKDYPERAVDFDGDVDGVLVIGYSRFGDFGRSRGVSVDKSPRSGRKK